MRIAAEWDRVKFKTLPERVMLETAAPVPSGTELAFTIDGRMPGVQGPEVPGFPQSTQAPMEPLFFAMGVRCRTECSASDQNPIEFSVPVHTTQFASALSARDITDPREAAVAKPTAAAGAAGRVALSRRGGRRLRSADPDLHLGPEARSHARGADGQALGYPAMMIVRNWNDRAFTSFGDGHGVWEISGGPQLPFYSATIRQSRNTSCRSLRPSRCPGCSRSSA
jgi:hypothetical protein